MFKALTPTQIKNYNNKNNPLTYCCCGCGGIFPKFNKKRNIRYYLPGHEKKGKKISLEQREKISKSMKKYRKKNKVSKETRKKISLKQTGKKLSEETKRKISKELTGCNNVRYKGGLVFVKNGYVFILVEDKNHPSYKKYIRLHRYIIEKFIGRSLKPEELIHHINFKKNDNRLGNLFLTFGRYHIRLHRKLISIRTPFILTLLNILNCFFCFCIF